MIFTSENYFKSKSLKDFIVSSKQSKYSGVLKVSVTTDYLDELSKNIIVIIPNETLKSIEIFENKDLNNFKNSLEKLNDSNDDEAVFSQVFNIDDE